MYFEIYIKVEAYFVGNQIKGTFYEYQSASSIYQVLNYNASFVTEYL